MGFFFFLICLYTSVFLLFVYIASQSLILQSYHFHYQLKLSRIQIRYNVQSESDTTKRKDWSNCSIVAKTAEGSATGRVLYKPK